MHKEVLKKKYLKNRIRNGEFVLQWRPHSNPGKYWGFSLDDEFKFTSYVFINIYEKYAVAIWNSTTDTIPSFKTLEEAKEYSQREFERIIYEKYQN